MLLDCTDRILILDGAMGTVLQARFPGASNFETLNLSDPDAIQAVHEAYIAAGADIIETNSFGANRISQEEYGLQDKAREMALQAARIARRAADKVQRRVLVAGSVGPTGKSLSLASDAMDPAYRKYDFDDLVEVYGEQIGALAEGGVDLILLETCFDALNVKAAIYAMDKLGLDLPLAVSVSVSDRSGRTLTGQTIEAFYHSVEHGRLWAFGLNCSLGAQELTPLVEELAGFASCRVLCYPNAGLPNEMGEYDQTPEQMAAQMRSMASRGILNIAGGCCGTTPEHVAAIAREISGCKPRALRPAPENLLVLSGLEPVYVDRTRSNFTNIGERTNVAGSRKFARLIAAGQYDEALQIAAGQIEGGAGIIDVNMDDAMLDSAAQMRTFLRHISSDPAVAKAALMVDSSDWETVLQGLKNAQGKCIVNSISLKEGEEVFLMKAREIRRLGAAMIVMAFDEQGQATDYARKIEICERAYRLLTREAGVLPRDIIFDVNVLSVGTGIEEHRRYGVDFIEAVRWIKANLPGARTSGGISNLSFAFRGNNAVREAMHSAFLFHAIGAGLDMGIVNPGMLQVYGDIEPDMLEKVEDVILDRRDDATERLIAKAREVLEGATGAAASSAAVSGAGSGSGAAASSANAAGSTAVPAPERLSASLVAGNASALRDDVLECLQMLGSAVAVIEGPLMDGMQTVGDNFAAGRMFLPQVVKSAKLMREAIDVLSPFMEADSEDGAGSKPKFLIATVKGDVHDIGKNITAIVLSCNGFDVTDLGVMVPKEEILGKAAELGADVIGVSGLITPSLFQMEELCREMSARGLMTPLFVGGATASALHTAVKLAPLYDHVFYGPDASASAVMAKRYMMDPQAFEEEEHRKQRQLRELAGAGVSAGAGGAGAAAAGGDGFCGDGGFGAAGVGGVTSGVGGFAEESYLKGLMPQSVPLTQLPLDEVLEFFDWRMFYATWAVKEDESLKADALKMLEDFSRNGGLSIRVATKFYMGRREGDDIVLEGGRRLPMLRQRVGKGLSLADFVGAAAPTPVGVFAASVHTCGDLAAGQGDAGGQGGAGGQAGAGGQGGVSGQAVTGGQAGVGGQGGAYRQVRAGRCRCSQCEASYEPMLLRSVKVTLAEAVSCWIDAQLEKQLAGAGIKGMKIVKPAAGYASCPDHTLKKDIMELIPDSDGLAIEFTESYAMIPDASICGFIFIHPEASYPEIRHLDKDSLDDYARRRGLDKEQCHRFLGYLLDGEFGEG